ncbi:MAG: hypothetical protein C0596_00510 [Marinilabiliales bacterium]|nr:MAG: hypothetical protein C0596_00510 [Marinilabiliales bacterium]
MEYGIKFYLAIIPIVLINLGLVIWSVIDWSKRSKFKLITKNVWLIIILFIQFVGPILYLLMGRDNDGD